MTFNHAFRTGLSVTLAASALSLWGCSTFFRHSRPVEEPVYPAAESGTAAAPEVQLTATEAAIQADEQSGTRAAAAPQRARQLPRSEPPVPR